MDGSGCAEPNRHVVRSQHCGASIKSVLLCVWGGAESFSFFSFFLPHRPLFLTRSCRGGAVPKLQARSTTHAPPALEMAETQPDMNASDREAFGTFQRARKSARSHTLSSQISAHSPGECCRIRIAPCLRLPCVT